MDTILFYEGKWYFFSNFSAFGIYWRGFYWQTVEHAYQASKFLDETIRALIREARSAHDAKKIAKAHEHLVRPDWKEIKLEIMEELIRYKIEQHPYVRRKLGESGEAILVEDSPVDAFWGRGPDGKGENHLGKIWMRLRGIFFP